ncbi:hydrogenase maturation protease [Mycobacterium ostraviense]|uniref:Peptidase M52 n=1 Tax=Mycobacterium ostraviense TaxID=2738409 RepID=A0A163WVE8_9MYCO|nr:hydrogenase maturation protease [Mycobacterium ostraviense]KZS58726.1 peptidase M52 [Mycobacterium ostraviense]UGT93056.1 hydrogenase maturation protease [Mycobacterium ostraviense]
MTAGSVVVVGLGNRYRRDDGVGVAAAAALDELGLPDVVVVSDIVEPMSLLEAWSGAGLAIVIDAAVAVPAMPGRVTRCALSDLVTATAGVSSHRVDVAAAYALGQALDRVPDTLEVISVDVADTDHGVGLTPQVEAAIPTVVGMVVDEIDRAC